MNQHLKRMPRLYNKRILFICIIIQLVNINYTFYIHYFNKSMVKLVFNILLYLLQRD